MNETLRMLQERRSIRSYEPRQILPEELDAVLQAGTYAPSGKGLQSAVMVAVQDRETRDYLMRENAKIWGKPDVDPFYGAPTVVVVLADGDNPNGVYDGALVMGNLLNAAHAVGLGGCWINRAREFFASADGKALLKKWGLPERYIGVGNCILGYAASALPAPKPRKADYILHI